MGYRSKRHRERQSKPVPLRGKASARRGRSSGPANGQAAGRRAADSPTQTGDKRVIVRFVGIFGLVIVVYYALASVPLVDQRAVPAYLRANATAAARVLTALGENAIPAGTVIYSGRFSVDVRKGCDAIAPSALFAAAVLASPLAWRLKIPGLVGGIGLLALLNFVRIVSLYYVGIHLPGAFQFMHVEFWQAFFVLFALILWAVWALWAVRRGAPTRDAT